MSRDRERLDEIAKKLKTEFEASSQMGRRHMLGPPGILNTITPCAACKLLRRRCAEECPFSPYFSPHEPQKFAAVHKVFGASNVSKLLMEVPESQRADAANSLVYEANVRLRDPVYGCMGAISALQRQIQSLETELHAVRNEILRYKYREAANNIMASTHHAALVNSSEDHVSIAMMPPAPATPTPAPPPTPHTQPPPPPPPPTPPPPPSVVVVVSTSSSSSSPSAPSLYTPPSSMASFNTITSNNIPFFD